MQRKKKATLAALPIVLLSGAAAFQACTQSKAGTSDFQDGGQQPGSAASPSPLASATPLTSNRQVYFSQLSPQNGSGVSGTAQIVVEGNQIGVFLQASGLAPNRMHAQHIHSGSQCATPALDANGDGYVDSVEGSLAAGVPVVPLDLSNPLTGGAARSSKNFPVASESGNVSYIASGNLPGITAALSAPVALASPLQSPSPLASASPIASASPLVTPTPLISPSNSPTPLVSVTPTPLATPTQAAGTAGAGALVGKVIEIHGISPDVTLPSTVRTDMPNLTPNEDLPVACGVIFVAQE